MARARATAAVVLRGLAALVLVPMALTAMLRWMPLRNTRLLFVGATRRLRLWRRRWPQAAKSAETAETLAKQIEELRAQGEAERAEFELRLAGCRSVRAARVLLAEHDGDIEKLQAAEPWLFGSAEPQGGTTGLKPAGAAGSEGADVKRWRELAGLDDK